MIWGWLAVVGLSFALISGPPVTAQAETWTDNTGTFQVEADFLTVHRDQGQVYVYLRKQNGKTIRVPFSRLSPASQQLARQLATAATSSTTPDAAVRDLMIKLQAGNFRALWDALPASYQADVNKLVQTFGQNMDADVWNAGTRIVGKAVSVLKDKKTFILGYPALQQPGVDLSAADKNWDAIVGLLDAIVQSELTDLDKLKSFDVAVFLDGTGKEISAKMVALAEAVEQDFDPEAMPLPGEFPGAEVVQMADVENVEFTTVSMEGDTATIRMAKADGTTEDHEAVRVEGKWLPKEMVDGWSETMAKADDFLTTAMPEQLQQNKEQLLSPISPLKMVEGVLDQMLAAQTQEDFNQVIDGIMQMVGGMMGGGEGPGGADPFGAPAAESGEEEADPFGADAADPFAN
jgi:hypothetical protein